jgi:hypothetical protein
MAATATLTPPKPGDILTAMWGYDQTNWNFFVVEKVTEKFVTFTRIAVERDHEGDMHGTIRPALDDDGAVIPLGFEARRRKLGYDSDGKPILRVEDYMMARPWDGKPKKFTSYA